MQAVGQMGAVVLTSRPEADDGMAKRPGQKGKPKQMILSVQFPADLVDRLDAEARIKKGWKHGSRQV